VQSLIDVVIGMLTAPSTAAGTELAGPR
jgi:hypothetical protein